MRRARLFCAPGPTRDAPSVSAFLQGKDKCRAGFLHGLAFFFVDIVGGKDDVSAVAADIEVPRLVDGYDPVADALRFRIGVIVVQPRLASSRAMPLVRREF